MMMMMMMMMMIFVGCFIHNKVKDQVFLHCKGGSDNCYSLIHSNEMLEQKHVLYERAHFNFYLKG